MYLLLKLLYSHSSLWTQKVSIVDNYRLSFTSDVCIFNDVPSIKLAMSGPNQCIGFLCILSCEGGSKEEDGAAKGSSAPQNVSKKCRLEDRCETTLTK